MYDVKYISQGNEISAPFTPYSLPLNHVQPGSEAGSGWEKLFAGRIIGQSDLFTRSFYEDITAIKDAVGVTRGFSCPLVLGCLAIIVRADVRGLKSGQRRRSARTCASSSALCNVLLQVPLSIP